MAQDPKNLAKRFAAALQESILELQGEKGIEKIHEQMESLLALSKDQTGAFFSNPVFSVEEKNEVLKSFLKKAKIDPALERFMELLVSLSFVQLLPEILAAYETVDRERRNEVKGTIRSAFALSKSDTGRIADALSQATGKKVLVDVVTDSNLIGGVVAQVGSVVYDASIQGYLDRMQEEF